jgi:hypothetical protein
MMSGFGVVRSLSMSVIVVILMVLLNLISGAKELDGRDSSEGRYES